MSSDSPTECLALKDALSSGLTQELEAAVVALRSRENIFTVMGGVLAIESVHSDMLCWLLRPPPLGWHGLGQAFASRFLRAILAECGVEPADSIEVLAVDREFSTGLGPIDLLITLKSGAPVSVVGIENKIESPETEGQLSRYAEGLEENYGRERLAIAYLTPRRRESVSPPQCLFTNIGYATVIELLTDAIAEAAKNQGHTVGLSLAEQYVEALRVNIMKEPTEVDGLCQTFYATYPGAWQALRRRLPSERDDLHAALGEAICKRFTRNYGGAWRFSVKREEYARVYRPSWRRLGTADDSAVVGIEARSEHYDTNYAAVHLRVGIEPLGDEADERFQYKIRGKVHTTQASAELRDAVRTALARIDGVKIPEHDDKHQFMIPAQSNSTLPSVEVSPDTVVDWIVRLPRFRQAVDLLDSIFGKV
jgi:hypothetical protein